MRHTLLSAFTAVALLAGPLAITAADAAAPAPMHHRHLVKVTGTIVAIDAATGHITLSNHHRYHFKDPQMVAKYKVGQKITLSFWS
jgi:Cu/Ag efflux protein CusF